MTADGDWVSITEAAARLSASGDGVDRSTLSRYVSQHGEALATRIDGRKTLVEFGALAQHRSENIRLRSAGSVPTGPVDARSTGAASRPRFAGSQSDGLARRAMADAEIKEMQLAERRGGLTPTGEVDRAARDAIALMMSAFERAIEQEANRSALAYGWDERQARLAFKQYARHGLDVFHREILERLDENRRERDAGDEHADRMDVPVGRELQ